MPRLSFIYRTDTHVADRSPASWKGDYPSEIWNGLRQIGKLADEREVTAVLDGGDYFHIKSASRNTHSLVGMSAQIHRAYSCPTFCVPGNHDLSHNNLDTLDRQPLGVLFGSQVFFRLEDQVFRDGDLQVRVVAMPYSPFRTVDHLRAIQKQPGDDFLIAVVHQLAAPDPPPTIEDFFGEPVFRYSDLVTPDGPDVWCFGHWHKDQGIAEVEGRKFVNLGAVSRGALIRENTERTPKVAYIEVEPTGIVITPISLDVAPAADVFDFERKERQEAEGRNIDQFVERLRADINLDPSASIETSIQALNFAAEVRMTAMEYLERARARAGAG